MDPTETNETPTPLGGLLRRKGLQLALGAPAVLAALHVSVASADDDDRDGGRDDDRDEEHRGARLGASVVLPLSRVADTSGSDFTGGGSDSLTRGAVAVRRNRNGNTDVVLTLVGTGQTSSGGYQVQFRRYNDHGSENIGGTFSTNSRGNFAGFVGTLSGHHRIGVIVVQHNGTDQYVTSVNL